mmetsp:Transcript_5591/g.13124  ORF Transcript_5591/g.13124 Transcript_5591/m.13124 type:complete len:586 (-) Transcript_5591:18-1775(-)
MALTPWHTLVAALWAGITCGFLYTFGTFGSALKAKFDFTTEISTISMCQVASGLITFTSGLLVDWMGIRATLLLGAIVNSGSWFFFGLIANGLVTVESPVAAFSFLVAFATWGGACVTGAVFTTLAKNFRASSAGAIGIAKAWVGVASGVATIVFVGFFPTDDKSSERLGYLWFLSAACLLGVLLAAPFLQILPPQAPLDGLCVPPVWQYRVLTLITLGLIAVTATASLLHDSLSGSEMAALSTTILVIVLCPALLLCPGRRSRHTPASDAREAAALQGDGAPLLSAAERPISPWASGPGKMLRRVDAWLLWLTIFALQTGGIVLTTNLSSITDSRGGGGSADAAEATAVFSCAQSLGRLFGGRLSDLAVRRSFTRPFCLAVVTFVMCGAHLILCIPGREALFLGVGLAGWAFGSMYPTMIVTISDLFGTERIGSNYMVYDGSPSASASILMGKWLATAVYEAHTEPGKTSCTGHLCYRDTFLSVAGLQLLAALCAMALSLRSRIVYRTCFWAPNASQNRVEGTSDPSSCALDRQKMLGNASPDSTASGGGSDAASSSPQLPQPIRGAHGAADSSPNRAAVEVTS